MLFTSVQYVEAQILLGGPKAQAPIARTKSKSPLYLACTFNPHELTKNSIFNLVSDNSFILLP